MKDWALAVGGDEWPRDGFSDVDGCAAEALFVDEESNVLRKVAEPEGGHGAHSESCDRMGRL